MVAVGLVRIKREPAVAMRVTVRSKMFQPEDMYSVQPSPTILRVASTKNTEKTRSFYYVM